MHGHGNNRGPIADRARRLLTDYFTGMTEAQRQNLLADAFFGLRHDPREGLPASGSAADFASLCVTHLLAFGCTDGRCHALSRLLTTIRERKGSDPHEDYIDLPLELDPPCKLPCRHEELAHLETLLVDCRGKAAKYSSLSGVARCAGSFLPVPDLQDQDDIALLRHFRRHAGAPPQPPTNTRDYRHILTAFENVPRAVLLGQPGGGKSTTLCRLAADRAAAALECPGAPLPILVNLGAWTGGETFGTFLAEQTQSIGDTIDALAAAQRLILLLDGLNEISMAHRAAKAKAIREYLTYPLRRAFPVVVACRGDDYDGDLDLGLDTLTIQPLSPQRVHEVLVHWMKRADPISGETRADALFWQLAGDPALASVCVTWVAAGADEELFWTASSIPNNVSDKTSDADDALWVRHVRDPKGLLRLVANPFMLNMLYLVWRARGGVLPRDRGDLFDLFVEILLDREGLVVADPVEASAPVSFTSDGERLLAGLTGLAWTMQGRRIAEVGVEGADLGVLTVVERTEALEALGGAPCGELLLKKALN